MARDAFGAGRRRHPPPTGGRATVVLVGAGHANLHVAAHSRELRARGAEVVLVDPGRFWYSGLATGVLGGMYRPEEDTLDPGALIEAAGGELVRDRVTALESGDRCLRLASGGSLGFDLVSLNVGSRVRVDLIPGMRGDPEVWPVKPVRNLWRLRRSLERRLGEGGRPVMAVVGGGASGCEAAANLDALARRYGLRGAVRLITRGAQLVPALPAGAAAALHRHLAGRGVAVRTGAEVAAREPGRLLLRDGNRVPADLVVLAVGLEAEPLVRFAGLPAHPVKGLVVNERLHSVADARIFAAGDCAHLRGYDLPNLGVFGVRQAAVVHRNLLASLSREPLRAYRPQRRYLSILNLGDGTALAAWGSLWWRGRASLRLKDRIDRRFLEGYRRRCRRCHGA